MCPEPDLQSGQQNRVTAASNKEVRGENEFVAGNIENHLEMWKKLTSDSFILNMVSGSEIPIENACTESLEQSVRKNPISED